MIDRREALRRLGAATLATSFISWEPHDLLAAMREHADDAHDGHSGMRMSRSPYRYQTLDAHQRATIATLAEMIIPTTETPGARDAGIDEFADIILSEWSSDGEKKSFLDGLAALDERAMKECSKAFLDATPAQRTQLLTEMDAELTAARTARRAWKRESGTTRPPDYRQLFFHQIRSLTVSGYYSSEAGYKRERKQVLIPGVYKPCMPTPVEG